MGIISSDMQCYILLFCFPLFAGFFRQTTLKILPGNYFAHVATQVYPPCTYAQMFFDHLMHAPSPLPSKRGNPYLSNQFTGSLFFSSDSRDSSFSRQGGLSPYIGRVRESSEAGLDILLFWLCDIASLYMFD